MNEKEIIIPVAQTNRTWGFIEPSEDDPNVAKEFIMTDQEILDFYWRYWYTACKNRQGGPVPENEITPENCIQDFVVQSWATELDLQKDQNDDKFNLKPFRE